MSEWISVKDRMPDVKKVNIGKLVEENGEYREEDWFVEFSDYVLVISKSMYDAGFYAPNVARFAHGKWEFDKFINDDVVYWMPLPKPPKELMKK